MSPTYTIAPAQAPALVDGLRLLIGDLAEKIGHEVASRTFSAERLHELVGDLAFAELIALTLYRRSELALPYTPRELALLGRAAELAAETQQGIAHAAAEQGLLAAAQRAAEQAALSEQARSEIERALGRGHRRSRRFRRR